MTRREILTSICRDKRCPGRMGLFEWFWQDTQAAWEEQGLPKSVDPAALEAEILPKLRAVREKRIPYIFMSDHSIPKTVRLETYERVLEIFRQNMDY